MKRTPFILFVILIAATLFAGDVQIEDAFTAAQNHLAAKSDFARIDVGIEPWNSNLEISIVSIEP
ncbi:MAG TPA: hypothetical protein ENN75_04055 [candidate division Zixibacteria bacterium]|nr:hypothetical protein [candidate division Zixibacteria bacterium]